MFTKKTNRLIALVLALLICFTSISTTLLVSQAGSFTSENLLQTHLATAEGILLDYNTGIVSKNSKFDGNGAIAKVTDGDKVTHTDVYGWNPTTGVGVLFTLDNTYYAGAAKIYSGFDALPDTFRVYAGDSLDTLYDDGNLIASAIVCKDAEQSVNINKNVKYIAFIYESDGGRVKELELWSAEAPEAFVSENILKTNVTTAEGILLDYNTGIVSKNSKFDGNGAIAKVTDGDKVTHTDVYGWNPTTGVGLLYTLDDTYYVGDAKITSGFDALPDTFRVYAGESLDTLYDDGNLIASAIVCKDAEQVIPVNKDVKYIAFILESDGGRVKEFELWTAEKKVFVSENLLQTHLSASKGIIMNLTNSAVGDTDKVSASNLAAMVDGDTTAHTDLGGGGAPTWTPPQSIGMLFTLDDAYYADKVSVFAGLGGAYPETWRVYASDKLDDLYSSGNMVMADTVCLHTEQSAKIEKKVKYVAFFCTADTGNSRPIEFQVWSGEEGQKANTPKKVLTIGNSFAENASIFATEIAAIGGDNLYFGYLKYPSCTIEQHYENAVANNAVYKFAYSEYTDKVEKTVVKDGSSTFATIKEALEYTDWDIVALQQGSTSSYTYSTYEKLDELIAYVKGICPEVEIMLHETWSWSSWATDSVPENNFKYIEDCYHKAAADNGNIKIIPTGRAFEFARRDYALSLNESDKQHANTYGQYLAGACYVATIFGKNMLTNKFGNDHPYFAEVSMPDLRTAVMNAINFAYDPDTNWDYADVEDNTINDPDSVNFIKRHVSTYAELTQDIGTGVFQDNTRFSAGEADASLIAIDGDTTTTFDVWGALDWEFPKNIGVMYTLDGIYNIEKAKVTAGIEGAPVMIDVYASDSIATLYNDANRVATKLNCVGDTLTVDVNKNVQFVTFVISGYDESVGNVCKIAEFDLTGNDTPIKGQEIVWPKVPDGENIFKSATPSKIIAPGGDYNSTKEFDYGFMDGQDKSDLKYLTDGDIEKHFDVWSLAQNDKPGILYTLDGYYDITHIHAWAGAFNSQLLAINGYRVYASDSLQKLYTEDNLIFSYSNGSDTTGEMGFEGKFERVRYIAIILTDSVEGGWRLREFAAFGAKSADQSEPVEQKSIIEGIDAEYYGVATTDLKDPIYMGASNFVGALTDGSRDAVEFWGGSDVENSKFVFIYNLYENYDLSGIDIYAFADSIEEDSGIHKGIRSATVYASRKFEDLFNDGVVLKSDYIDKTKPDETSFYSTDDVRASWKAARYVAFVFTIGDTRYGACRLEELKVYGTLSAVQDVEEEEPRLPQYIDIESENGVIARIFALNASDDLSKLDAHLKADISTKQEDLSFVDNALFGYKASSLYDINVVDANGADVALSGRRVRLSIPEKDLTKVVACVDDFGAEIVSSGVLNDCITVETETLRKYAIVSNSKQTSGGDVSNINWVLILTICLGVLAGVGVGVTALFGFKLKKK